MSETTLLRGGTVIDGTGRPGFTGDVLVEGDKIVAVGVRIDAADGTRVIDVTDRVVCPGFIDLHSHADFTLLAFPAADSAVRQGITTVGIGNCGGGAAPRSAGGDFREVAFAYSDEWGLSIDWTRFGDYSARLDGTGVNVAPLVAHGPIRNAVMGMEARAAASAELEAMTALLRDALDAGAFGMSTGLQYLPGSFAAREELVTLVAVVGAAGRTYATHMRNRADSFDAATQEALATARGTGARLQISHFAPRPYAPRPQVEAAFAAVDAAVENGEPVAVDTFPEIWGPGLLVDLFPADVMAGTTGEVLRRLGDPATRHDIGDYFDAESSFLSRVAGYEQIYISGMPEPHDRVGKSLPELAASHATTVGEVSCELLIEAGDLFRTVGIRHIYATEDDLRMTLALPYCSVESDGVVTTGEGPGCPLTWNASSYGYTARVLEHYVRQEAFLSLEDAIHKMTELPARAMGLRLRGSVAVGHHADLVVFDPTSIKDRTSPDDMARHPAGIDIVMVNGAIAVEQGKPNDRLHGRLLHP